MGKPTKQQLYQTLNSRGVNVGTYEQFENSLNDDAQRRSIYDKMGVIFDNLPTYEDFSRDMRADTTSNTDGGSNGQNGSKERTADRLKAVTDRPGWKKVLEGENGAEAKEAQEKLERRANLEARYELTDGRADADKATQEIMTALDETPTETTETPTETPTETSGESKRRARLAEAEESIARAKAGLNNFSKQKTDSPFSFLPYGDKNLVGVSMAKEEQKRQKERIAGSQFAIEREIDTMDDAVKQAFVNANNRERAKRIGNLVTSNSFLQLAYKGRKAHLEEHDIEKLCDEVWALYNQREGAQQGEALTGIGAKAGAPSKAEVAISKTARELMDLNPDLTRDEAMKKAEKLVRGCVYAKVYEQAVSENMPGNWGQYLIGKINDQLIGAGLTALARKGAGTSGDLTARKDAMSRYAQDHSTSALIADVLSMVVDPSMLLGGFVGKGVGAAVSSGLRVVVPKVAMGFAGKAATAVAAGSANFAVFEGANEVATQIQLGGELAAGMEGSEQEGTLQVGDYNFGAVMGKVGHGALILQNNLNCFLTEGISDAENAFYHRLGNFCCFKSRINAFKRKCIRRRATPYYFHQSPPIGEFNDVCRTEFKILTP